MARSRSIEEPPSNRGRIVVIDVARGVALVAMTVYHFTWDLSFFGYLDPEVVRARPWVLFARSIATSFLFLVGVSLVLGHGGGVRWRSFLVRLAQVVAGAVAISIVTYLMDPATFVAFGILHAIALFSILGLAFLALPWWLTAGVAVIVWTIGNGYSAAIFQPPWFLWTGLAPVRPISNDYVPLFPFFAATLAGIAAGRLAKDRSWFDRLRGWRTVPWLERPLDTIGRHSLAYYLLHQPVLFALLTAWTFVLGPPDVTDRTVRAWTAECRVTRSEAFCDAYVGCVVESSKRAGLFDPLARNRLSGAERSRVAAIVEACATR